MYCDLHGHSRKKNIFMYGCDQADNSVHRLKERIFPRLLAKNSDMFSFADCSFKVQKSKDGVCDGAIPSFYAAIFCPYWDLYMNENGVRKHGRISPS
jgi:hypothetical protein